MQTAGTLCFLFSCSFDLHGKSKPTTALVWKSLHALPAPTSVRLFLIPCRRQRIPESVAACQITDILSTPPSLLQVPSDVLRCTRALLQFFRSDSLGGLLRGGPMQWNGQTCLLQVFKGFCTPLVINSGSSYLLQQDEPLILFHHGQSFHLTDMVQLLHKWLSHHLSLLYNVVRIRARKSGTLK